MRSIFNDAYAILFSVFLIEAYEVGTRLNCLGLSRQFKRVPTTYIFYKEVDKKYTGCNLLDY